MTAKAAGTDCRAVSEILSRVGDKWTIQVVVALRSGSQRFNGIKRLFAIFFTLNAIVNFFTMH